MKKITLFSLLLTLCACEQPKLETYFITWNEDAQTRTPFYIKIYEDRAEISDKGQTQTWEKVSSRRTINKAYECFHGVLPTESLPSAELCFNIYINENIISPESIVYDKQINNDAVDAQVYAYEFGLPYESEYKPATQEEICIDKIEHLVYIKKSANNDFESLQIYTNEVQDTKNPNFFYLKTTDIPAEEAIKISPNWDYSNPKFYHNAPDWVIEDYEKDACETLERLNKYMENNNIKLNTLK